MTQIERIIWHCEFNSVW